MLWPCSPPGRPHPQIKSSILVADQAREPSPAPWSRRGGQVVGPDVDQRALACPPIGERPNATITASVMSELWSPSAQRYSEWRSPKKTNAHSPTKACGDDGNRRRCVELSPTGQEKDQEKSRQPQRPRKLAPAEHSVSFAFQDQLARQVRSFGSRGAKIAYMLRPLQAA